MNLNEATYIVRFLTRRKLAAAIVTMFEDGQPDYQVVVRRDDATGPLDIAELGQAAWLLGFRMMLTPSNVLTFEAGPALLAQPMDDMDDVVDAQAEEDFVPAWTQTYGSDWSGRI